MRAIVLVNAYLRQSGMIRQAERVREELCARGVDAVVEKNGNFLSYVRKNSITVEEKCDFVVYLDKDKYLPRMLEARGLRLFNRAEAVELCDDKMFTVLALADKGLHLPDTVAAPLCYYPDARIPQSFLRGVGERLGYPLIVKKSFGSWGMDVRLVRDEASLAAVAEEFRTEPHLFQKRVGKPGERRAARARRQFRPRALSKRRSAVPGCSGWITAASTFWTRKECRMSVRSIRTRCSTRRSA